MAPDAHAPTAAAAAAPARMPLRCGLCGHARGATDDCSRCNGTAVDLDGGPVRPGRRMPTTALFFGMRAFARGLLHVALRRELFGLLWIPVLANALAVTVIALLAWLWLLPFYDGFFDEPWSVLEGLRQSLIGHGPLRLTVTTVWLLGPPILAIAVGAALEPLHAALERSLAGPGMRTPSGRIWGDVVVDGLRSPARLLALALLALPILLPLSLVPWVGMPLVWIAGALVAGVAFCEPAAARRGLDARQRLSLLRRNWAFLLGYGLVFELMALFPLVNLLGLAPAAAVASAALYFRFDKGEDQG